MSRPRIARTSWSFAANPWVELARSHPKPDCQVLVQLHEGVGFICDVAIFVGKQPDDEMRWIMSDVRLESRQIVRWAYINPPLKD